MAIGYVADRPGRIVIVYVYALGTGGGDARLKVVGVIVECRVVTKLIDTEPDLLGPASDATASAHQQALGQGVLSHR
jgi:hypothetical protein